MLLINGTVMLIITWDALGFCTGSGNVFPFSVDLSDFCRNFRVESNTTIKSYIGTMFCFSMKSTLSSKETVFLKIWPQIDIRSAAGRKKEWIASLIVSWGESWVLFQLYITSCKTEKFFNFDRIEHWILIVSRYWWETLPMVGDVGGWKKRVAVFENAS